MESPNSTENRKSGTQASIASTRWKPSEAAADPVQEDEHDEAVRGADREQVQHDRRRGTTIERNAMVSRMKLRPSTNTNTVGSHAFIASM